MTVGERGMVVFFLTEETDHPHLNKHLASVTTLIRVSPNWKSFKRLFVRAFPGGPTQGELWEYDEPERGVVIYALFVCR